MSDKKVINIKYKQMDRDPKIQKGVNELEKAFLGEKGVGLSEALGLTPGKFQKYLDDQFDKELQRLLDENKKYILEERNKRAVIEMEQKFKDPSWDRSNFQELFLALHKQKEFEVIKELMEKEGLK